MAEVEKCPVCGSGPLIEESGTEYVVSHPVCVGCFARDGFNRQLTGTFSTVTDALSMWNVVVTKNCY